MFRMPDKNVRGVAVSEPASVGAMAPDFELPALIAGVKKTLRLNSYRGTKVVLAFYPYNWREVSAKRLIDFQIQRPRVLACHAEIIAVTVDSIMNTTTWEREIGPFDFPICSDFWPHGEACARYGVLRRTGPDAGASESAVFLIDQDGRVVFRKIYGPEEIPALDEVFTMLERL